MVSVAEWKKSNNIHILYDYVYNYQGLHYHTFCTIFGCFFVQMFIYRAIANWVTSVIIADNCLRLFENKIFVSYNYLCDIRVHVQKFQEYGAGYLHCKMSSKMGRGYIHVVFYIIISCFYNFVTLYG